MLRPACCLLTLTLVAALNAAAAARGDDLSFAVQTDRQPSAEAAQRRLRETAVTKAIEEFLGPRSGRPEDDQLERRMLALAKGRAEQIVSLEMTEGPYKHKLLDWVATANCTVRRGDLESIKQDAAASAAARKASGSAATQGAAPPLRIMVLITDNVEYINHPNGPVPISKEEAGSHVGDGIAHFLTEHGFETVNPQQFEFLKGKRLDYADLRKDDFEQLLAIKKDQGVDVLVLGRADVTGPDVRKIGGRDHYYWSTTPKIAVVWQDTAVQFDVPFADAFVSASDIAGPVGARAALRKAGQDIGRKLAEKLVRTESGPRPLDLRIQGLCTKDSRAVDAFLASIGAPTRSRVEGGVYVARLTTDKSPADLAELLEDLKLPSGARLHTDDRQPATLTMKTGGNS